MGRRYARAYSKALGEKVKRVLVEGGDPNGHVDWGTDIFMAYPSAPWVLDADSDYYNLRNLYQMNKAHQRRFLHEQGFTVPETRHSSWCTPTLECARDGDFVVRPLRHTRGRQYTVSNNTDGVCLESNYISRVFPKKWEYRVFITKGNPIVTLVKKYDGPDEDVPGHQQPWNRGAGYKFITVHNRENDRLRHTNLYPLIESTPVFQEITMAALDVMLHNSCEHGWTYAISELNFAPLVTLPANLKKMCDHYASFCL